MLMKAISDVKLILNLIGYGLIYHKSQLNQCDQYKKLIQSQFKSIFYTTKATL